MGGLNKMQIDLPDMVRVFFFETDPGPRKLITFWWPEPQRILHGGWLAGASNPFWTQKADPSYVVAPPGWIWKFCNVFLQCHFFNLQKICNAKFFYHTSKYVLFCLPPRFNFIHWSLRGLVWIWKCILKPQVASSSYPGSHQLQMAPLAIFFVSWKKRNRLWHDTPPPELRKAANQVTIGCYDALVEVAHFTCSNWPPNAMVKAFNWHFNAFLRIVCRMQSYLCSTTEASSCGPAIHYTFNGIDLFSWS